MTRAKYGPIEQIGYLVDDLDASITHWIQTLGIGPWTVFRNVRLDGTYHGRSGVVTMDVGLAYQANIQIELIKVTNETPSPYRDQEGTPLLGVHHVAWMVDDVETTIAGAVADGMTLAFRASNPATEVAYMEITGEPGLLFEFIQGKGMREMMDAGIAASKVWDGSNPVHEIDTAA